MVEEKRMKEKSEFLPGEKRPTPTLALWLSVYKKHSQMLPHQFGTKIT
jgi:hypothetical protein